jgi:hypothetical protein
VKRGSKAITTQPLNVYETCVNKTEISSELITAILCSTHFLANIFSRTTFTPKAQAAAVSADMDWQHDTQDGRNSILPMQSSGEGTTPKKMNSFIHTAVHCSKHRTFRSAELSTRMRAPSEAVFTLLSLACNLTQGLPIGLDSAIGRMGREVSKMRTINITLDCK